jgi:hypothetical protein
MVSKATNLGSSNRSYQVVFLLTVQTLFSPLCDPVEYGEQHP